MGDFTRNGDSQAMYALNGLSGHLDRPEGAQHGVCGVDGFEGPGAVAVVR